MSRVRSALHSAFFIPPGPPARPRRDSARVRFLYSYLDKHPYHPRMQGIRTVAMVSQGLREIVLPSLTRPASKPTDHPTEELVKWGTKVYAYSLIAHLRTILSGLLQLADTGNAPAAFVVSRHIFEWAAHSCYVCRNLTNYIRREEWVRAWSLLTIAATGNLWAKQHGAKYATPDLKPPAGVPDPLNVANVISAYERYQRQQMGSGDARDSYGLLSELSHPNSACFQQYHRHSSDGRDLSFIEPDGGSPLPIVNWCLLDLLTFLDKLLQIAGETSVRPANIAILNELAKRAPATHT